MDAIKIKNHMFFKLIVSDTVVEKCIIDKTIFQMTIEFNSDLNLFCSDHQFINS